MDEAFSRTDPRRVNLGDAMILIIALGAGLALALRPLSDLGELFASIAPRSRFDWTAWCIEIARKQGPRFLVLQGFLQLLFCLIIPLTPALLVARLRQPRPAFRRLACQPGLVASAALCVVSVIEVDVTFLQLFSIPPLLQAVLPGGTVLASWAVLLVSGRWQPEASWVDRAGRAVGGFWIATIPLVSWLAS
jgi:hypothetical protein